jgi:phage gp29-like protein
VWTEFDGSAVTPSTLLAALTDARKGEPWDFLEYAEQVLERDAQARSCWTQRVEQVLCLPVAVEPATDSARDREIAERVRVELVEHERFARLRRDLFDGVWRGYSVVEIVWDPADQWSHVLEWRDPTWFVYDREDGSTLLLRSNDGRVDEGEPLIPGKFIVHEPRIKTGLSVRSGVAWPVLSLHLFASFALRYWMRLAERHGVPVMYSVVGEGTSKSEITSLRNVLERLGPEGVGVLPSGTDLQVLNVIHEGNVDFHAGLLDWLNKATSKAILAQTMTTDDGSSLAQASVHADVGLAVRDADARALDATIQRDYIDTWVRIHYGEGTPSPRVRTVLSRPEDAAAVARALLDASNAAGGPLPVQEVEVLTRLGWTPPEVGDRILGGGVWTLDGPSRPAAPVIEDDEPDDDGEVAPKTRPRSPVRCSTRARRRGARCPCKRSKC